ncbi:Adenylate isopentenyltransferase 5, chloroplastic [Stylosanthes scabra]|uniref:Adenylate isopentenyltransferase 5, chloroplastic n=1 Tax=Stylosanthes scabra TaxID=79078 RepID=A0ABU6S824_9FABA|nr:Adenylate isopentenyltransferase 5, chloroplastic [Stylosanthes scabra]
MMMTLCGCKPLLMTTMESLFHQPLTTNDKVVVVMGATGTGKSKLAIDIATHFKPAEIVNSDKIQVFKGLNITTNKVTEEESRGVPHHLLGFIDPNAQDFTATRFCEEATRAVDSIVERDALPVIAGGSNSFIEQLVNQHEQFRLRYKCCFLWVDVSLPVLHSSLEDRVDRMVESGQVNEVREFFDPSGDYSRGIRRAIGVPEFHEFLRAESMGADEATKKRLLEDAIATIKVNNCKLANRQLHKIQRLHAMWKRSMHRLDATEAFLSKEEEAWEDHVVSKARRIVQRFLYEEAHHQHVPPPLVVAPTAMAAVTH